MRRQQTIWRDKIGTLEKHQKSTLSCFDKKTEKYWIIRKYFLCFVNVVELFVQIATLFHHDGPFNFDNIYQEKEGWSKFWGDNLLTKP